MTAANKPKKIIGTIKASTGVIIQIPEGQACNYAGVKVEQLNTLLNVMIRPGFNDLGVKHREIFTLLAATCAQELDELIDIVIDEAAEFAIKKKGGA